jgi:hypothetical protein
MDMPFTLLKQHRWEEVKASCESALSEDHTDWEAALGYLLAENCCKEPEELAQVAQPFWDNEYYRAAVRYAPAETAAVLEESRLACAYRLSDKAFWAAATPEEFLAAGEGFSALEDYRDASRRYYECQAVVEKIRLEQTYRQAEEKMQTGKAEAMDEAKYLFSTLGTYRDAEEKAVLCDEGAQKIWVRQEKQHIALSLVLAVLVLAVVGIVAVRFHTRYGEVKEQAAQVAQNLAGRTFSYSYEDDGDFHAHYSTGTMVDGTVYYQIEEERTLRFNDDGTVYYRTRSIKEVLAYPVEMEEPRGYSTDYDGTYQSYSVAANMSGEFYLVLGESRYALTVDENNVPTAILGYYSEPLT